MTSTLPLALLGPERYPIPMGLLALPIMFAMALASYVGAVSFQHGDATLTFVILLVLAFSNVALVGTLWVMSRRRQEAI